MMDPATSVLPKRTSTALVSVAVFALTLFLFCPVQIYVGNFKEFSFLFHESLLFFLALSLILAGILSAAVLSVPWRPRAYQLIVSILLASGLLMWLQRSFMPWPYGILNGGEIEWNRLFLYGILDSLLWAGVMAVAVVKAGLVFRITRFAGLLLIVVQLLSALQLWLSMPRDQSFRQQPESGDTLFLFSRHVNVIIVVLDTFQSDLFQDVVEQDPDLRASFDGFTYFRNSLSGSDATSTSIPNMLTARNYDNSVPYLDFVKQAFLENSLPKTLNEYGFDLALDPIVKYSVYTDFDGAPTSPKKLMDWGAYLKEQAFLVDLSLFRSLPHFLKELVYHHQKWLLSDLIERVRQAKRPDGSLEEDRQEAAGVRVVKYEREFENSRTLLGKNRDAAFIRRLVSRAGVLERGDAFRFYHLNGVHLQLVMNENLEYEPQMPTRDAMQRQGAGILKITAILLERLQQLGVYDNSLIFVVGDHGSGLSVSRINPSPLASRFNTTGPYKGLFRNFKSAGIPLILVKRINSRGPLRTNDAPVSLGDIPRTVAKELGLAAQFPGRSMFHVKADEERERIYRPFVGDQEEDVQYFAPLYEYAVNGFSWDTASWKETGRIYYPKSN